MKNRMTLSRIGGAIALGTLLSLSGAQIASAAEHDATTADGVASVQIDFGTEFAGATATVLVLDADADPKAPEESDIAYVAEVLTDEQGIASFRAALPGGLDYWLASTVTGGERYVAMLDGSEGVDPGGDGGDGDGTGDGDGSGDGDGTGDGDGGGAGGSEGGGGGGAGSDAGGQGSDTAADGDLATTGLAAWMVPVGVVIAGGLITTGATLMHRRRARP